MKFEDMWDTNIKDQRLPSDMSTAVLGAATEEVVPMEKGAGSAVMVFWVVNSEELTVWLVEMRCNESSWLVSVIGFAFLCWCRRALGVGRSLEFGGVDCVFGRPCCSVLLNFYRGISTNSPTVLY